MQYPPAVKHNQKTLMSSFPCEIAALSNLHRTFFLSCERNENKTFVQVTENDISYLTIKSQSLAYFLNPRILFDVIIIYMSRPFPPYMKKSAD